MDAPTRSAPERIGIVGTGLIGAGFAGLVARRHPELRIEAVEPHGAYRETVAAQMPQIAWHASATDLAGCDMVFLACPPAAVTGLAREIHAAGPALVIDFASVKARIVEALSDCPRFIGGHPLAGGNRSGPFSANSDTLAEARMVLTPHPGNAEADLERVEHFLAGIGWTVVRADAEGHDALLARTSHLPHLMAYAYAASLTRVDDDEIDSFASRSTRDSTRFASGNTRMWRDILDQNGPAVSAALDDLILDLMTFRNAFAGARTEPLGPMLDRAAARAASLNSVSSDTIHDSAPSRATHFGAPSSATQHDTPVGVTPNGSDDE